MSINTSKEATLGQRRSKLELALRDLTAAVQREKRVHPFSLNVRLALDNSTQLLAEEEKWVD